MLTDHQLKPLLRALRRNSCVLFLGAGFSADALDPAGVGLPSGRELARRIWTWLGYGEEDGQPEPSASLAMLANSALSKRGEAAWIAFLRSQLTIEKYPPWYSIIPKIFWRRIYTLNVDHLVESLYRDAPSTLKLNAINALQEGYRDLDGLLESVQYVKLNGSAYGNSPKVTFSVREYASRSSEHDPWYDHFVRDYTRHTTILVGTQLDEPLFWRAVESRAGRIGAATEQRRRSFLVSPTIDPVTIDALVEFNVVPVEATGAEFFNFIDESFDEYPDRGEVLALARPQLAAAFQAAGAEPVDGALADFFKVFTQIETIDAPAHYQSLFLLGAMPTWEDLALGLDARRAVNEEAFELLDQLLTEEGEVAPVAILGHRGSGKSTLLMRTGVDLSAAGHAVFFASGEDLPKPHVLAASIDAIEGRVLLCVDDSEWFAGYLDEYLRALGDCERPPVLALVLRANQSYFLEGLEGFDLREVWIGDLSDADIDAVIDVLEGRTFLVRLQESHALKYKLLFGRGRRGNYWWRCEK